jgi:hypothetical protein
MPAVRSVVGLLSTYLLALMLAGSFPVGTNNAAHHGDLLHWVLPHVHFIEASSTDLEQPVFNNHRSGGAAFAVGGEAGAALAGGILLMPPVPVQAVAFLVPVGQLRAVADPRPSGWSVPVPERPPSLRV